MYEAYPLQWPKGWPRTGKPKDSNFKMAADAARKDLLNEIFLLSGDRNPVISSNVPLRKSDRQMYAAIANDELDDSGVALYFILKGKQMTLACDKWLTPAENIRALGLTINAMRGLERWGSSQIIERAFTGFQALPEVSSFSKDFWEIFGFSNRPDNIAAIQAAYKSKAKIYHPDKPSGSTAKFTELNAAYQLAIASYDTPPG